jgi:hypothetical protein
VYANSATSLPLGHNAPQHKVKRTVGEQHFTSFGSTFGVSGGNPTALFTSATGESTSPATEVADDEVGLCIPYFWRLLNDSLLTQGRQTMARRPPTN